MNSGYQNIRDLLRRKENGIQAEFEWEKLAFSVAVKLKDIYMGLSEAKSIVEAETLPFL